MNIVLRTELQSGTGLFLYRLGAVVAAAVAVVL